MARYIDADEAKKRLLSYYECVRESTSKDNYHGETLMSYEVADMVEDCIENTPTADVQDVRHGYWHADAETGCLICSECGHFTDEIIGDLIKAYEETENFTHIPKLRHRCMNPFYCSKCGARMDGKETK